jgi:hypothetical protein
MTQYQSPPHSCYMHTALDCISYCSYTRNWTASAQTASHIAPPRLWGTASVEIKKATNALYTPAW